MDVLKTTVDSLTGEVVESTIVSVRKVKPDEFIQVYLEDFAGLLRLTGNELKLLLFIWRESIWYDGMENLPGNKVVINKQLIDSIASAVGVTEGAVRNSISKLSAKSVLLKDAKYRGIYYLNPEFFFKGKIGDRTKRLRVVREYDFQ